MKSILVILIPIISFILYRLIIKYIKKKKRKALNRFRINFFIDGINRIIEENIYNVLEGMRRLKEVDGYGNENLDKWFGNPPMKKKIINKNIFEGSTKFKEGIPYFWIKVTVRKFDGVELFFEKWNFYK